MANRKIKLGVLDQSIIRKGGTAAQAVKETIETAKLAEKLGYSRFWVSEHHNSTMLAGSTPEVLMVKLADETSTIKIGSGGIMLPNHSALKVAENFRMLELLFPGRIDLGMGRAPGGDRLTSNLLNPSNTFSEDSYLRQLEHLNAFFRDEAATQYGPMLAVPQAESIPQQWILSSSGGSSSIAARYGLGLVVAKFINGNAGPEVVQVYRDQFKPSDQFEKPLAMLSISVICAETEERAQQLRKISDYVLVQFEKGIFEPLPSYDDIAGYHFSPEELYRVKQNNGRIVSGTPAQVKAQLTQLANDFDIDEIIIATMTYDHQERLRSFELLAEAFELNQP